MITKPKARKFRIKRSTSATVEEAAPRAEEVSAVDESMSASASSGPRGDAEPSPAATSGEVSSAAQVSGEQDMDAIRKEGLTGRQLRMARRVAQKHGLPATSDFDAVRLLRAKGIDPFQRRTRKRVQ